MHSSDTAAKGPEDNAAGPLQGLRVLDTSRLVAGNILTHLLADLGAEVVKVEAPRVGDDLRNWKVAGVSTHWKVYSRDKKSLSLNLKSDEGKKLFLRLAGTSSVIVENFRPGVLEALGLGPEVLWQANPALVIARISGWGQTGPWRDKPGFGSLIEAMSGFAAMNGFEDRPPVLPPFSMADSIAGIYGAAAVLAALRAVEAGTVKGQIVDLSLFDPIFSLLGPLAAEHKLRGAPPPRLGSRSATHAPRNVYRTADGKWIALSTGIETMFRRLARAMGDEGLADDPRFRTNADRVRNVDELDALVGAFIAERTLQGNLDFFEEQDITAGIVADIADLVDHPYLRERGALVEISDDDMGALPMHGIVPRFSGFARRLPGRAPALGEHNHAILAELGLAGAEIEGLVERGIVGSPGR